MKESKISFNLLFGGIFFFIGLLFFVLGICFGINIDSLRTSPNMDGDPVLLVAIFTGMGALFMVIGAPFLFKAVKNNSTRRRLLQTGYYVMAKVTEINVDYSVTVNGRHPFFFLCEYTDAFTCVTHVFKSPEVMHADDSVIGNDIRVYVDQNNFDQYYVDVTSVHGNKVFH